jgi:PadR family transcriptional regulator, regulatory protein PadR
MARNTIGPFEFDVLASLIQQPNDAYGLSLRDRLEERLGRTVSLGAVYTALERLEAKGMVGSWWTDGTPERGGRRKRLYRIEAPGEEAANVFASRFQHGLGIVGGVA